MRRTLTVVLTASILATAMAATALAARAHRASETKVQLVHTSLGEILADSRGFTLYMFTLDSRNHDSCVSIHGCTGVWPLLTTHGKPVAGKGVKRSLLGSIKLSNGTHQLTYAGFPLYTYTGDTGPRSTGYVGITEFGGAWYALSASGKLVK
jgi:predicted lipoprotein with Yx(FWY)xxD motif